jgi:hypothetical protein
MDKGLSDRNLEDCGIQSAVKRGQMAVSTRFHPKKLADVRHRAAKAEMPEPATLL